MSHLVSKTCSDWSALCYDLISKVVGPGDSPTMQNHIKTDENRFSPFHRFVPWQRCFHLYLEYYRCGYIMTSILGAVLLLSLIGRSSQQPAPCKDGKFYEASVFDYINCSVCTEQPHYENCHTCCLSKCHSDYLKAFSFSLLFPLRLSLIFNEKSPLHFCKSAHFK